jgi:uncharacterized membrane protein
MEEKQENLNESKRAQEKGRLHAIVAYIPFLCFIALFSNESDEFTRMHGRQGFMLLIVEIIAMIMLLPIGTFFWKLVLLACLIISVTGIIAAFSGKSFSIPIIGKWADKIK